MLRWEGSLKLWGTPYCRGLWFGLPFPTNISWNQSQRKDHLKIVPSIPKPAELMQKVIVVGIKNGWKITQNNHAHNSAHFKGVSLPLRISEYWRNYKMNSIILYSVCDKFDIWMAYISYTETKQLNKRAAITAFYTRGYVAKIRLEFGKIYSLHRSLSICFIFSDDLWVLKKFFLL